MSQKTSVSDFIIYGTGMDPKTFHMLGKHTNTGVTSQPVILSFHLIFFPVKAGSCMLKGELLLIPCCPASLDPK